MDNADTYTGDQNDSDLLLELATRLLSRYEPPEGDTGRYQLLPGQIPQELTEVVPFPEGIRIVGSEVTGAGLRSRSAITVIFDTELSKENLPAYYDEHMLNAGWSKPEPADPFPHQGGFSHSLMSRAWADLNYYCRGPREPYLVVQAFDKQDRPTDVRLSYVTDARNSPCDPKNKRRMSRFFTEEDFVVPNLIPPARGLQTPKGGQAMIQGYFAESIAYLKSDIGITAIRTHYSGQLEKHGWQQIESGGDETRAWSKFTFEDQDEVKWWGLLLITAFPTRWNEYLLYVLARYAEAEAQFDDFISRGGISGGGVLYS